MNYENKNKTFLFGDIFLSEVHMNKIYILSFFLYNTRSFNKYHFHSRRDDNYINPTSAKRKYTQNNFIFINMCYAIVFFGEILLQSVYDFLYQRV